MAILSFNFSGVYKRPLLNGGKTATILNGRKSFGIGEEVLVYLSNKDSLFDDKNITRIGKAKIKVEKIKEVRHLTEEEATKCSYDELLHFKNALKYWYNVSEDNVITYIEFDLVLE